jgi:hypothetical protein
MRFNSKRKENLTLNGRTSDKVETFLNLGSVVTKEGRTEQGVKVTSAWHTQHSCKYFQYGNLYSNP